MRPITPNLDFREDELERYSRHILLPQVGGTGQDRLRQARVLVVGAGGLGSPALLYLAAAGVGHITVIDGDSVDLSNLQRQVIHGTGSVGTPKALSAAARMAEVNPDVVVEALVRRIGLEEVRELVGRHDVVLDGTDNFATRYLLNDACHFERVPLVSAAVHRFEGQLSVFMNDGSGPCYRCLFRQPPPAGSVPPCSEAGVLGVVVGVLGTMQAVECIKVLLGIGEPVSGALLRFDALVGDWMRFEVPRDASCALCGAAPTIRGLELVVEPPCEVPEGR